MYSILRFYLVWRVENQTYPPICCTAVYYVEVQLCPLYQIKSSKEKTSLVTVFLCVETRRSSTKKQL